MPTQPDRLILASRSPRRRQLLQDAGYRFAVLPADDSAECGVCSGESPSQLVTRLARQKAENVAAKLATEAGQRVDLPAVVLGCDTVAALDGQIFGKPADEQHARQMLLTLSGRQHQVYSGVCLMAVPEGRSTVRAVRTTLQMAELSDQQLEEYLESGLWEGKAGSFGYQDNLGWVWVLEGSESNVVGLPLEELDRLLASFCPANSGPARSS